MDNPKIEICPYLRGLLNSRDGLTAGIDALTQLHRVYGDELQEFDADDFLETRDLLAEMRNYVSGEILRIIANRIRNLEKNNL